MSRNCTRSPPGSPSARPTSTATSAWGSARVRSRLGDGGGQPRAAARRASPDGGGRRPLDRGRGLGARARRARRRAGRSPPARRAGDGLVAVAHDLGEVVAVLAAQVARAAGGGRGRWPADPGSSSMPRRPSRSSAATSSSSASSRVAGASRIVANGARPPSAGRRGRERVARPAVVGERLVGRGRRPRGGRRRRPARPPRRVEPRRPRRRRRSAARVELGDLEPQQVDLAGPCPLVAAERGQLGVELGRRGPGPARAVEVDAAERGRGRPAAWPRRAGSGGRAGRAGRRARRQRRRARRRWPAGRRCTPATGRRPGRPG